MIDFLRHSDAHIFPPSLDDALIVVGDECHHLSRVLRLRIGNHVSAALNGSVREYVITAISHDEIHLKSSSEIVHVEEPSIELFVSLFKVDRLEWGIAKAVETGATRIVIGETRRSPVKLSDDKKKKIVRRIELIIASAAQQSRRSLIPECHLSSSLIDDFLGGEDIARVVCEPDGNACALSTPLRMLIGPEGGFDETELTTLAHINALSMGPYILRAETAMSVAPALVLSANQV